jgi:hypothetical protein
MFSVIFTIIQWIVSAFVLLIVGLAIYVMLMNLFEDYQ